MHNAYQTFLETKPTQEQCCRHIERFLEVETELEEIAAVHIIGPLHISALPVKHSLTALTVAWKLEFTNFLHKQAQVITDPMVAVYIFSHYTPLTLTHTVITERVGRL